MTRDESGDSLPDKVIHNLLEEVERVAVEEGVEFRGLNKSGTNSDSEFDPGFHCTRGHPWNSLDFSTNGVGNGGGWHTTYYQPD